MSGARRSAWSGRALTRVVSAAFLALFAVVTISASFVPDAFAQERKRRWFSLREIFTPRSRRDEPKVLRDLSELPRVKAQRAKRSAARKKQASVTREPQVEIQQKDPDARVVLVVGDFIGAGLARGLGEAYSENPKVSVIDRTRASSGLVRSDVYDWPEEIADIIEKEKPAVVVLLIGSNDRQQMRVNGDREAVRSDAWTKEYANRAEVLAKAIAETSTPMLWVGLPSFKSTSMSEDILAFNEIYRSTATTTGAAFVDVWDGFIDEEGAYVTSGPDINGQQVRLRTSDGINLTSAGKRKIAFYAERPLAKLLGLSVSPASIAALPDIGLDPRSPVPLDRTVPMSLDDPALDGGLELMGATPVQTDALVTLDQKAAIGPVEPGDASPDPDPAITETAGRADDFSWPRKIAAPKETAILPVDETVSSTR
ncbi:MAG: DUF459 domain-containing protein [Rhizobiaceae bacterium]|nr:DUF459 domain-containing protein [Rhizobiaceae bacterium]